MIEETRPVKIQTPSKEDVSAAMNSVLREECDYYEQAFRQVSRERDLHHKHSIALQAAYRDLVVAAEELATTDLFVQGQLDTEAMQIGLEYQTNEARDMLSQIFKEADDLRREIENGSS